MAFSEIREFSDAILPILIKLHTNPLGPGSVFNPYGEGGGFFGFGGEPKGGGYRFQYLWGGDISRWLFAPKIRVVKGS